MRRVPIDMYVTRWCPVCNKARAWLRTNRYQFVEYDVETNRNARRTQKQLNPRGSVPTFYIDGRVLVGFSAGSVKTALKQRAKQRLGIR